MALASRGAQLYSPTRRQSQSHKPPPQDALNEDSHVAGPDAALSFRIEPDATLASRSRGRSQRCANACCAEKRWLGALLKAFDKKSLAGAAIRARWPERWPGLSMSQSTTPALQMSHSGPYGPCKISGAA